MIRNFKYNSRGEIKDRKVFVLQALTIEDITELLRRALKDPRGFGSWEVEIDESLLMLRDIAPGRKPDLRFILAFLHRVLDLLVNDTAVPGFHQKGRPPSSRPGAVFRFLPQHDSILLPLPVMNRRLRLFRAKPPIPVFRLSQ